MKYFAILLLVIGIVGLILFLTYSGLPSLLTKRIYKSRLKHSNSTNKTIYLTFDDGMSEHTPMLLDTLRTNNVLATFFIVASCIEKNVDTLSVMKTDGHCIGLHSYNHNNFLLKSVRFTKRDFDKSMTIMQQHCSKIDFYRPPWGDFNLATLRCLKKYSLKMVFWSVFAEDWQKKATVESISAKLIKRVKNGSIICLHDGRGHNGCNEKTIQSLNIVLPQLIDRGYIFSTMNGDVKND